MISHPDTSNDHILSSDNIHYLHHSFFEPSNQDMAIKATTTYITVFLNQAIKTWR